MIGDAFEKNVVGTASDWLISTFKNEQNIIREQILSRNNNKVHPNNWKLEFQIWSSRYQRPSIISLISYKSGVQNLKEKCAKVQIKKYMVQKNMLKLNFFR